MAFIPTPNTARAAVECSYKNRPIVNTLWFSAGAPFTLSDLEALVNRLDGAWASNIMPLLDVGVAMVSITAWAQDSETAPSFSAPPDAPTSGGVTTGTPMPPQVAAVATFYTAARGRTSRGRNYLAGMNSNHVSASTQHLDTSYCLDLVLAYNSVRSTIAALGMFHVVVSHQENKVARIEGLARGVTSVQVNTRLDTQRGRLGKT